MLKKSYFKNIKKKLVGLCIALGLFTAAFSGLSFNSYSHVLAYNKPSSDYFSDANFTSYSGSSPLKPSHWSLVEGEGNFNSETMVGAIFNSNSPTTSYLKKYKVFNNPGLPTTESITNSSNLYYSLALSAPYNAGGRFGFKPSSSKLNLTADSFYSIEVTLKTITLDDTTNSDGYDESYASSVDSMASIYLDGIENLDNPELAKFEMIQSRFGKDANAHNGWGTYIFYIATNQLEANDSLDLELWLGSKSQVSSGSVFFNNIQVYEMDHNTFLNSTKTTNAYSKVIDLRSDINTTPVTNSNFTSTWTDGWNIVSHEPLISDIQDINVVSFTNSNLYDKYDLTVNDNPTTTNSRTEGDNKVLFMANSEDAYTAVESVDELVFKRQSYYKVSVWAWSNSSNTKAYAVLKNTTDNVEIENASIEILTNNSVGDGKTNGWTEYSFYVYGNPFFNTTAKLQLALGSVDSEGTITGTTGYVYFDNITVQEISYSQFSDNSSNSNCTTFNYNSSDSEDLVKNYTFDITENEDHSNTYPLSPASWNYSEITTGENVTKAGVVNTHSTLFDGSTIGIGGTTPPSNPQSLPYAETDSYNNVLMIGSRFVSTQEYKSLEFSLNANSYYKISMYVNAVKGGAGIKISNKNGTILNKTDITSQGWTKFTTFVRTGASEDGVVVTLSLNNISTTTKYVFFDEVIAETSSESVYNNTIANTNNTNEYTGEFVSKVDLLNYDFENDSTTEATANGFTVDESNDNKFARIQNTSVEYGISAHSGNNALVIFSNDEVNGVNYLASANRTYTLSADSYYKISVFVKTLNIHNGGATITISSDNLNESFYDINTESQNTNNWTEYTFFINVKAETTATLSLGIGNETTKSSGYAMFDDITIEKIADEDTFTSLTTTLNNDTQLVTIVETSAEEDSETTDEETEPTEESFEGSFNWYIATSLITALAIIIAVVGVMLRKVDFKQNKKVKTQYDRRRTLDVSLDKKERIAKRQQEIYELEKQLKEIEDEIAGIKRDVETEKQEFESKHNEAKAEIEQRKQAIVDEKEKALHERNEKIAKDKNAFTREEEEKFASYIKKLEKQEQKENLEIQKHDKAISNFKTSHSMRLQKSLARQEFIKAEIARIDAEIEAIAKEEAQIWEDYRLAKADAKRRKAEYKAEQKALKNKKSSVQEVVEENNQAEQETTTVEETTEEVTSENNAMEETTEVEVITPDDENK